jgi:hypothetical protein
MYALFNLVCKTLPVKGVAVVASVKVDGPHWLLADHFPSFYYL